MVTEVSVRWWYSMSSNPAVRSVILPTAIYVTWHLAEWLIVIA
jgi:hypothetical protein